MAHNGETQGESAIQPYQQTHSLFQATALIRNTPRSELLKYLDTPIVPVGDLYYIDNLVAVLEASSTDEVTNRNIIQSWLTSNFDQNSDGRVNGLDFGIINQ